MKDSSSRKQGLYMCMEPTELAQPVRRKERFYMIYNSPPPLAMLKVGDVRNRWLMQFRGERVYYYFVSRLSKKLTPFHRDSLISPVRNILERTAQGNSDCLTLNDFIQPSFGQQVPDTPGGWGEPFVLTSLSPEGECERCINQGYNQFFERIPGTLKEMGSLFAPLKFADHRESWSILNWAFEDANTETAIPTIKDVNDPASMDRHFQPKLGVPQCQ